ncbi:MAG: serine/threonine-protein kinase, partial [Pyrinomonadaceae bacterium]
MNRPHDHRIMELVHSCSDMGAEERAEFLAIECADDPEVRREVESLVEESGLKTIVQGVPAHFQKDLPSHYRLIRMIGSGGMGEVFLAEDTRLGRRVAIKFLNDTFKKDPDRMRRFDLEARSTSALNHPNILTIYDIGGADGVKYIVSEYVDGETLWTRLGSGRLSVRVCLEIAIQIASALKAAHEAGVVHRDLKPDNIMLRSDGSVKVVDFGLAKASGHAMSGGEANTLEAVTTSPGIILGTPRYMSPEQTRGISLDGRSDIFSLGIIVFEMLTGSSPFGVGSTVDIISA